MQHLGDAKLERRIWEARAERKPRQIVLPNCAAIHTELKRHKHVTLQLLWEEYHASHLSVRTYWPKWSDSLTTVSDGRGGITQ